jgi:hypothetical protein
MAAVGRPRVAWPWVVFAVVAVVGQCVALYLPDPAPVTAGFDFPGFDKILHLAIFAVPTWALIRVVRRRWIVPAGMLVQAVGSEFLQGALLPHRSGDALDAAADAVGIVLGLALAHWTRRRPG